MGFQGCALLKSVPLPLPFLFVQGERVPLSLTQTHTHTHTHTQTSHIRAHSTPVLPHPAMPLLTLPSSLRGKHPLLLALLCSALFSVLLLHSPPSLTHPQAQTPLLPDEIPSYLPHDRIATRRLASARKAKEDDEEEPPLKGPYSLGVKISNWDEQRAAWLARNPKFPNYIKGKPRIMLVTGSQPTPCENPVGDHYLVKSIKNKIDYCRLHNIEIFYNMAHLDSVMSGFWAKLPLLRKIMLSHPEVEWIWWMDSDAMFTDMVFELPIERYKDYNAVFHGWDELVYNKKSWIGLNTGSFLIRNCQWTLDLLDTLAPMGPKGKVRDEAGKILTRTLEGRPEFEADDQSAMIYLLVTQRSRWGDKVYLESQYYLHGYWVILVDKYEEMIEKYHPGLGDDRWPFVTHFVGCKPCGKGTDYAAQRCIKQMERAFNFADDQILQMYGFQHKRLGSWRVKRIRNETDRPLDFQDDLKLLPRASLPIL